MIGRAVTMAFILALSSLTFGFGGLGVGFATAAPEGDPQLPGGSDCDPDTQDLDFLDPGCDAFVGDSIPLDDLDALCGELFENDTGVFPECATDIPDVTDLDALCVALFQNDTGTFPTCALEVPDISELNALCGALFGNETGVFPDCATNIPDLSELNPLSDFILIGDAARAEADSPFNQEADPLIMIKFPDRVVVGPDGDIPLPVAVWVDGTTVVLDELFIGGADLDDDGNSDVVEILICGSNPTNKESTCDDFDADGRSNAQELVDGTDPRDPTSVVQDYDSDGLLGTADSCPFDYNPSNDAAWCIDSDGDGLANAQEENGTEDYAEWLALPTPGSLAVTDPLDEDSDDDNITDRIEQGVRRNPDTGANGARYTNLTDLEVPGGATLNPTDPNDPDSDGDGLWDDVEQGDDGFLTDLDETATAGETDATEPDTDGDLLGDYQEFHGLFSNGTAHGYGATYGWSTDSDQDGLNDTEELVPIGNEYCFPYVDGSDLVSHHSDSAHNLYDAGCSGLLAWTNPLDADSDDDGLSDAQEVNSLGPDDAPSGFNATDPWNSDSDNDGISDADEIAPPQDAVAAIVDPATPSDPTSASDPGSIPPPASPLAPLIALLIPECNQPNAPDVCDLFSDPTGLVDVEALLDSRDLHDADGDESTEESNGQIDLVEENLLYLGTSDATLDVTLVLTNLQIGSQGADVARVVVGDLDADDDRTDVVALQIEGVGAVCISSQGENPPGIATNDTIEQACGDAASGIAAPDLADVCALAENETAPFPNCVLGDVLPELPAACAQGDADACLSELLGAAPSPCDVDETLPVCESEPADPCNDGDDGNNDGCPSCEGDLAEDDGCSDPPSEPGTVPACPAPGEEAPALVYPCASNEPGIVTGLLGSDTGIRIYIGPVIVTI